MRSRCPKVKNRDLRLKAKVSDNVIICLAPRFQLTAPQFDGLLLKPILSVQSSALLVELPLPPQVADLKMLLI
jgi:hypothetical protein